MPTLTADEIPDMLESEEFTALPYDRRAELTERALTEAGAGMAGQWTPETWREWGDFTQTVRGKVQSLETVGDDVKHLGGVLMDAGRGMGRAAIATAADLSPRAPDGSARIPGQNLAKGLRDWLGKADDTASVWGAELGDERADVFDQRLAELKDDIDRGNLPLPGAASADEFGQWLEARSNHLGEAQAGWYDAASARLDPLRPTAWRDTQPDLAQQRSLMHPAHAQLLADYLTSRNEGTWEALVKSLAKSPERVRIETAEAARLSGDPMVRFLDEALLPPGQEAEYAQHMQSASDPLQIAQMIAPPVRGLSAVASGGKGFVREAAKSAAINTGLGVASLAVQEPGSSYEDYKRTAKEMVAVGLGFHLGGAAVGAVLGSGRKTPAHEPVVTNEPNPFEGDIVAPPQPREDGGVVVPPEVAADAPPVITSEITGDPDAVPNLPPDQDGVFEIDKQRQVEDAARAKADEAGQPPPAVETPPPASGSGQSPDAGGAPPPEPIEVPPPKRAWRLNIPERADGHPFDMVDFIRAEGSIGRPPRLERSDMGRSTNQYGEHDALRRMQKELPAYYAALTHEHGRQIDEFAQQAYEENLIKEPTADAFMEQLNADIHARRTGQKVYQQRAKEQATEERKAIREGTRQDASWKKTAHKEGKGKTDVYGEELKVGDAFELQGEPFTVIDMERLDNGEVGSVLVEDGDKFGRQWIAAGERVFIDDKVAKAPEAKAETPAPKPEPTSLFDMNNTLGQRARNRGETTKPQVNDPLAELGKATREGEATRAQQTMQLDEETLGYQNRGPATRGPLPSKASAVAPQGQARTWSGEVQTLHGLRKFLLDAVGLPAVGVGRFKRALGIYRVKPETVRLQAINDLPVLAHEIGHAIHFRELNSGNRSVAPDWNGAYDSELMPMGKKTSLPSYKADQVRKEGVAEFTRLWLTDPSTARAQAPQFAAFWEGEITARNPRLADGLREAQRRIQDYIAMPAFEKAKAQVVFDPESEKPARNWGERLRGQYTEWVDTLAPAKRVLKQTGEMAPQLATEAARVDAWMENHRGGWSSKADADVFGTQTDLHGNRVGAGLKTILKDLQPGDGEAFSTYLALKRAIEIEASGRTSGFEQARLPAAEMNALEKRFEPTRQKLLKWSDNSLQLLVDSGLLDSEAAAKMRAAGKDYVPFYRLYEKLNGVSFGPEQSANGSGFVDLSSGIRRLKGSDRAIIDPLQSLMKNAFMFRKLAEQNHIGVQFFDVLKKLQGHGKFAEGIAPKMKGTKIGHDIVVQKLIDEGVIQNANQLPVDADLTLTLWEAMKKPDTKTGEVIVFNKGKREHWEVKDAQLMKALKTADADAVRLASFLGPVVTKALTLPARTLRFGATGGPWFAIPNFIRDQFTAAVQSKTGYIPFWDGFHGLWHAWNRTREFQRWQETGGEFSGVTTHTQAFTSMLEDVLPKDNGVRAMAAALASPRHWQRALGAAGKLLEEATRVGEFTRGLSKGLSEMEAANASKSVSLNFARSGEVSRTVNMLSAFFNAKVQELDMIVQNHRTRPVETMLKGVMYITVPSVLTWMLGRNDKKIQDLPEWRKNLFWNVNLDPVARALGYKEGFVLSLPKPFLMGMMYGTSVERALDQAYGLDPNGGRKALQALLTSPAEIAETPLNIAGLKPLIEAATNHDFYRGRDIVPDRMKHLEKAQQYDTLTSETSKKVGRALGVSPMMLDHLLRGYFATAGKYGTDAIDWGMAKIGMSDVPPAPTKGIMELPVLNRFAGSPYAANAFVERFYKAADDMEGKLSTFNKQSDQMTESDQKRWWEKNGDEVMFYQSTTYPSTRGTAAGDVRKAQRVLSEIGKAMKDVQADRKMTSDAKRERLQELSRQRNDTAEAAFKNLFPLSVKQRHY